MGHEILLFFVAIAAGAINSVAGGGTFLTFPALLFTGMPAITANATSTVALLPGNISSVFAYKKLLENDKGLIKQYILISVIGGIAGSILLLVTPEQDFKSAVPWLLLLASAIFTFGRQVTKYFAKGTPDTLSLSVGYKVGMFLISVYGGFFGAGYGILTLALFELAGAGFSNIHKMNGLRTILAAAVNSIAVIIFIYADIVDYRVALIMAFGAIIGGYYGATIAQKVSSKNMRRFIIAVAWVMTFHAFLK